MLPEVKIAPACWREIQAELDRVFPCEGLVVPLVTLTPRSPDHDPWATLRLEEIGEVMIARAVKVPDALQINSHARVSVRPRTDALVNAEVETLLTRYPRLRACAYLHSHPFAIGSTWPSRGLRGDYEGHMIPLLEHDQRAGLETCFSFIACRDRHGTGWRLRCFALDPQRRIVDLGFATPVEDPVEVYQRHLVPGFEARPLLTRVLERWRAELRRRGFEPRTDELFDGWQRTVVDLDGRHACAVLLPITFPLAPARCFLVDRRRGTTVPLLAQALSSLTPYAAVELIAAAQERCHVAA